MERGGHSREPDSIEEGKPLKKARYVWEVKGKHHMKKTEAHSPRNQEVPNPSGVTMRELQGPSDCCLESFLSKTEEILDRDYSDDEEKSSLENVIENEIPVTLVLARPKNQDYYLRLWQAQQIARSYVDNTVNSMLERFNDRSLDVSSLIEDCENDGQVEDDAILMAIQAHGLQSVVLQQSPRQSEVESRCDKPAVDLICENYENYQRERENEFSVTSTSSSTSGGTPSSNSNQFEEDLSDQMDFLNAAVSVAIQEKGLTYS
ncbi:uncharacterized protein LOC132702162 [Cylas formicarius]|uniref:uncharacterized protein LOC132702162 n=1 Tax=Cylas formicarius TaxID=197179 RepID=UPI00295887C7|nr:uncharacterized protein LOC132702162 [Cylas formicarius]